jgi:O-antigen/teichoic acid export membrane protein
MSNKRIIINAASASLQVIITGLIYFFLYRYLVKNLGAAQLGIWSLVLATSSIANLANFGITSGLVKFVAEYKASQKENELSVLVSTAFFTICIFFIFLILILYIAASFILKKVVDADHLQLAMNILPFSLLSLFFNGIGGVFTSVLEGCQKNYLRNTIYSTAIIVLFLLTFFLTPKFGLEGVAYAQVMQSFLILIAAFLVSYKFFKNPDASFFSWKLITFKEIMGYGLKFQVVSICQMMYEPTTKALLSKFGGLSLVGYYEMSSRLVSQIRALIVNANQVMIPVITEASFKETDSANSIKLLYSKTLSVTLLITIPLITGIVILAPLISKLWIGQFELSFIIFTFILSIANLINIICGPAYFGFMGTGILNPLIKVHVLMAFLNIAFAYTLGIVIHGYGVILAWGISLSSASLLLIYNYNKLIDFQILPFLKKIMEILLYGFILLVSFIVALFCIPNNYINEIIIAFSVVGMTSHALLFVFYFYRNTEVKNNVVPFLKLRKYLFKS